MLGHTVKLMPLSYVKAYLKRSKNDANDKLMQGLKRFPDTREELVDVILDANQCFFLLAIILEMNCRATAKHCNNEHQWDPTWQSMR